MRILYFDWAGAGARAGTAGTGQDRAGAAQDRAWQGVAGQGRAGKNQNASCYVVMVKENKAGWLATICGKL